jgi:hypothetical protein
MEKQSKDIFNVKPEAFSDFSIEQLQGIQREEE